MNESYFFIGGLLLFFIFANLIIYFYLQYKRESFFNSIKNREYTLIKKVETETEGYSQLGAKIRYTNSDIVFLDDEIFILTFNKAILQLTKSQEFFPGIYYKYSYESKLKVNDRLEIRNSDGSIKVNLNFKNKNFDLEHYLNKSI
jgi:hypothetical protein